MRLPVFLSIFGLLLAVSVNSSVSQANDNSPPSIGVIHQQAQPGPKFEACCKNCSLTTCSGCFDSDSDICRSDTMYKADCFLYESNQTHCMPQKTGAPRTANIGDLQKRGHGTASAFEACCVHCSEVKCSTCSTAEGYCDDPKLIKANCELYGDSVVCKPTKSSASGAAGILANPTPPNPEFKACCEKDSCSGGSCGSCSEGPPCSEKDLVAICVVNDDVATCVPEKSNSAIPRVEKQIRLQSIQSKSTSNQ